MVCSWKRITLDLSEIALDGVPGELIELDASLERLRTREPEKGSLSNFGSLLG